MYGLLQCLGVVPRVVQCCFRRRKGEFPAAIGASAIGFHRAGICTSRQFIGCVQELVLGNTLRYCTYVAIAIHVFAHLQALSLGLGSDTVLCTRSYL